MHQDSFKDFIPSLDTVKSLNFLEELDYSLAGYDYELPLERIAQNPASPRDSARLLVVDSPTDYKHCIFRDLPQLLQPGDLLVMNDTRVIPARLYGRKTSGAAIEVLLLEEKQFNTWLALVKPGKRLQVGAKILFGGRGAIHCAPTATVLEIDEPTGGAIVTV